MKSKDLAVTLQLFADTLEAAAAREAESAVRQLAGVFEIAPSRTVIDVTKLLTAVNAHSRDSDLEMPLSLVRHLRKLMTGQAKASLITDLAAVEALLASLSGGSLAELIEAAPQILAKPQKQKSPPKALREDIVRRYSRILEDALGDEEGFTAAYKAVDLDPEVGKLEAAAIARAFTGSAGSTKPAAMKKIWARHHNLMTFRAKSRSRDGRSAA